MNKIWVTGVVLCNFNKNCDSPIAVIKAFDCSQTKGQALLKLPGIPAFPSREASYFNSSSCPFDDRSKMPESFLSANTYIWPGTVWRVRLPISSWPHCIHIPLTCPKHIFPKHIDEPLHWPRRPVAWTRIFPKPTMHPYKQFLSPYRVACFKSQ